MLEIPIALATRRPKSGQDQINSECDHDILATQILSHSFHVFSSEWLEIPFMLGFMATRRTKLGQYWPKSIHFGKWSGYISIQHLRQFCPCISFKCHETPISPSFWPPGGRNWANTGQNRIISWECQALSACGISGHSFHAFSLNCPETPLSLSFEANRGPKFGWYRTKWNHLWRWILIFSGQFGLPLHSFDLTADSTFLFDGLWYVDNGVFPFLDFHFWTKWQIPQIWMVGHCPWTWCLVYIPCKMCCDPWYDNGGIGFCGKVSFSKVWSIVAGDEVVLTFVGQHVQCNLLSEPVRQIMAYERLRWLRHFVFTACLTRRDPSFNFSLYAGQYPSSIAGHNLPSIPTCTVCMSLLNSVLMMGLTRLLPNSICGCHLISDAEVHIHERMNVRLPFRPAMVY